MVVLVAVVAKHAQDQVRLEESFFVFVVFSEAAACVVDQFGPVELEAFEPCLDESLVGEEADGGRIEDCVVEVGDQEDPFGRMEYFYE